MKEAYIFDAIQRFLQLLQANSWRIAAYLTEQLHTDSVVT
jgi:hypothetical protein